jgi:hypothetical protein
VEEQKEEELGEEWGEEACLVVMMMRRLGLPWRKKERGREGGRTGM